jgi:hypothetical protein
MDSVVKPQNDLIHISHLFTNFWTMMIIERTQKLRVGRVKEFRVLELVNSGTPRLQTHKLCVFGG